MPGQPLEIRIHDAMCDERDAGVFQVVETTNRTHPPRSPGRLPVRPGEACPRTAGARDRRRTRERRPLLRHSAPSPIAEGMRQAPSPGARAAPARSSRKMPAAGRRTPWQEPPRSNPSTSPGWSAVPRVASDHRQNRRCRPRKRRQPGLVERKQRVPQQGAVGEDPPVRTCRLALQRRIERSGELFIGEG